MQPCPENKRSRRRRRRGQTKKKQPKNPGLDDDQEERAEKQKNKVFLLDTKGQDVIMCCCHGLHVHTIKNTDTETHTRHNQAARTCLQLPYLFYEMKSEQNTDNFILVSSHPEFPLKLKIQVTGTCGKIPAEEL